MDTAGTTAPVRRRRVLIVNAYFDYDRQHPTPRPLQAMQSMAPAFLAGTLDRDRCEVRLYSEHHSGPLSDEALFGWPDLLVLTGLTSAFDRMLHLTAYARSKNPAVLVAAGGPAVRAMPRLSAHYFDYACTGDIEQLRDVVDDAFGPGYSASEVTPRHDLLPSPQPVGYIETTRNCNFACSFCSLTGEANPYQTYDPASIERQVHALRSRRHVLVLDNNFYGNNRAHFLERVALLRNLHASGALGSWSALVTGDLFVDAANVRVLREAGCIGLFSGVESFDTSTLQRFNKRQNLALPQVDLIRNTLEAGMAFVYGLIADVTTRSIADIRSELDFIANTPEITLPVYVTLPIPLPGTPYFSEALRNSRIMPNVKLRDLEGSTISLWPKDPLDTAAEFARDLQNLRGHRLRMLRHSVSFARRYRGTLSGVQMALALAGLPLLTARGFATSPLRAVSPRRVFERERRTYVSSTEPLDPLYEPAFNIDRRFSDHFTPTMVTDERGELTEALSEDLLPMSERSPTPGDRVLPALIPVLGQRGE